MLDKGGTRPHHTEVSMIQTSPALGTTITVEQVDPTRASEWLDTAATNRPPRQGKIDQYARDMLEGRWRSSILRFDQNDRLVDGQHRLWAVVETGSAQQFYVERGLDEVAVRTIDTGLVRTNGDILAMRGEPNARTLASAIRVSKWIAENPGRAPSGQSGHPYSSEEIVEYLDAHPEIHESVLVAKRVTRAMPFKSAGVASALHHLEGHRNKALADKFWDQIATSANMAPGSGAYHLNRALIADRLKRPTDRMNINTLTALCIKGWNVDEEGRSIRQLRWVQGRQQTEAFPRFGVTTPSERAEEEGLAE